MVARGPVGIVACLVAAGLVACGTPPNHEYEQDSCAIINGDPDTTLAHQAVVYIDMGNAACSGTLIAPRVVLTAAHCVDDYSTSGIDVGFGNNRWNLTWRGVSEKWVHPNYDPEYATYDIAMVRLSSVAPSGVTPIPHLPSSLGLGEDDIGIELEFVGFGVTETGSSGTKLTVTGNLDWICESPGGCDFGYPKIGNPNTICTDQSPGGPCQGDSGGPAFVWRAGAEYVAGVTSYGINDSCTVFGCSSKVDRYTIQINDFVGGVNGANCVTSAECDSGYCVDGVCCESACTGTCMACNVPGYLGSCRTATNGTPCPDSDPCDGEEVCQNGTCVAGAPPDCDDDEPCTNDSCQTNSGCVHQPVADGTSCSDENPCNGEESCRSGTCTAGAPMDCDDGNPCTHDGCNASDGCRHYDLEDGTQCFDDDVCNGAELCQGGVCLPGNPIDCDDHDPCTRDTCDPVHGCGHQAMADGSACDDNNACTRDETCQAGVCGGGASVDCDDLNPCTADSCRPGTGCHHEPVADGTSCGGGACGQGTCRDGVCEASGAIDCDDGDPCTNDGCDPDTGCIHTDAPGGTHCNDDNPCTLDDTCLQGVCQGGQANDCDDHESCTEDGCDPASGCQHDPVADGTACGGGMCGAGTCAAGACQYEGGDQCADTNPCTRDWCDPSSGCLHENFPEGYACGDCQACIGGSCTALDDCGDGGGCGCAAPAGAPAGAGPAGLLLLGIALVSIRRRRH